jgi:probable F420-dependent oxidoreductase
MRYGFCLPHHRSYATRDLILETARRGEALGYDTLWLSDHIVPPLGQQFRQVYFEPLVLTGWVASATARVKLGYSVLVLPYRNPVVLAKQLATIDVMAEGRIIVGVGVGTLEVEYRALGVPFNRRGRLANEYLRVIRELWTNEQPRFHGETVQVENVYSLPKPHQQPGPPIIVGGESVAAIRRAVELGDGWHPSTMPLPELADGIQSYKEMCAAIGRPPGQISYRTRFGFQDAPHDPSAGPRQPFFGTPAEIVADLETCAAAGVDELNIEPGAPWIEAAAEWNALFDRFTTDVLPHGPR